MTPDPSGRADQRPSAIRGAVRIAFWLYAAALFIATHWPRFEPPDLGIERPDLYLHAGVFAVWTVLLILTGYMGSLSRARSFLLCGLAAAIYAAIDESLQALPFLDRHAALDDWAADVLGVVLAVIAALTIARLRHSSLSRARPSE